LQLLNPCWQVYCTALSLLDDIDDIVHAEAMQGVGAILLHLPPWPASADKLLRLEAICAVAQLRCALRCRQEILQTYAQQLSGDDLEKLAAATPGMSGRDLRDVAEQAERRWASKARLAPA